ncbi:hypothetical protein AAHZ94_09830 [Streptomyces sp. HSW2009]|uniref:hypothetical protein n=1 Tax=Streptomyces sp. HSW2009 TaxID=3142890 RepID=UPI0032EF52C7
MTDSAGLKGVREFTATQYVVPYLLLVTGNAGVRNAPVGDRPVLFWVFAAVAVLGAGSTLMRLRRMWATHQHRPLPAWTRFLGLLLALFGAYVGYVVIDGAAGWGS